MNLLCEQIAIHVLFLNALDLVIDDLKDLVCRDEVIFLPDIDDALACDHLITICVQVDLNHL